MTVERLHFDNGAEHFVRYAAAKTLAPGRCVLNIACGEGYGSWLLREWGAREVVGIDVSDEAIAVANTRFAREGVRFLLSNANHICDLLGDERVAAVVELGGRSNIDGRTIGDARGKRGRFAVGVDGHGDARRDACHSELNTVVQSRRPAIGYAGGGEADGGGRGGGDVEGGFLGIELRVRLRIV